MRSLSADEQELWRKVTQTIRPLSREPIEPDVPETTVPQPAPISAPPPIKRAAPGRLAPKVGTTLDGSWDKRLRSGAVQPDCTIDLHGMYLDRAWTAIDRGLEDAIARGDRVILLITGHHRPGEPPILRGRIRAAVHDWLAASRHAAKIAAVRGAHGRHGGGGSLYLILRRR